MNPELINLGFISIRWYSVLILIGFILGYILILKECNYKGIQKHVINDICFNLVIISILGARIYYCIFNFGYYSKHILDIFKIWEGGLAIHGGIISVLIYFIYESKRRKINLLTLLDLFAPSLALGQAIGRWGNFFNGEAYGSVIAITKLRNMHIPKFIIDGMYINHQYHHPTFLYESIGCLIIFIILMLIRKFNDKKRGIIISIYFILYGIIRFFIESLRTDSLMFLNFKIAQIVSILMIIIGTFILINTMRGKYDKQEMGYSTKR